MVGSNQGISGAIDTNGCDVTCSFEFIKIVDSISNARRGYGIGRVSDVNYLNAMIVLSCDKCVDVFIDKGCSNSCCTTKGVKATYAIGKTCCCCGVVRVINIDDLYAVVLVSNR